jgi:phage shock protein A
MFEDLRNAFRQAVDNFRDELNRDQVPEAVDRLLRGMMDETASAKANLTSLEAELERTQAQAAAEAREVKTCLRREAMARQIDDDETANLAAEYAARHLRRQEVLDEKAAVLAREVELRTGEVAEMMDKVREARERRDALTAQAGRTGARSALGGADDLFAELDRMAERIGDTQRAGDAASELGQEFGSTDELHVDPYAAPRRPTEEDLDDALAELKRRMGKD